MLSTAPAAARHEQELVRVSQSLLGLQMHGPIVGPCGARFNVRREERRGP